MCLLIKVAATHVRKHALRYFKFSSLQVRCIVTSLFRHLVFNVHRPKNPGKHLCSDLR